MPEYFSTRWCRVCRLLPASCRLRWMCRRMVSRKQFMPTLQKRGRKQQEATGTWIWRGSKSYWKIIEYFLSHLKNIQFVSIKRLCFFVVAVNIVIYFIMVCLTMRSLEMYIVRFWLFAAVVDLITWWRLVVSNRNVAIHNSSDYIVPQTIILFIIFINGMVYLFSPLHWLAIPHSQPLSSSPFENEICVPLCHPSSLPASLHADISKAQARERVFIVYLHYFIPVEIWNG